MIRRGIGVQSFVSAGGGTDADAQAVITAIESTGVTLTATQKTACNTLVTDLKGYGIWTKLKAVYGFLGGTAGAHKWNWKNPADTDAAFRLVFSGGWTHSSTGALPNGTNGYADTKFIPSGFTNNNTHLSFYSRTNSVPASGEFADMGAYKQPSLDLIEIQCRHSTNVTRYSAYDFTNGRLSVSNSDARGLFINSRTANNSLKGYKNGVLAGTNTNTNSNNITTNNTDAIYISAMNGGGTDPTTSYSNRECAFASIGDGLTDTEAANLYTAVQAYQTTLGRSVGTQTVSDSDAQAFVNAAVIEDQVQATAINTLVTDLKGYGIWSKMKAIYPFCGSTATQQKYNLKDPRDLDAAFRLVFSGGITHSSTGVLWNGTNGYANSYLIPSSSLNQNSQSYSYYSRSNTAAGTKRDMGGVLTADLTQDVGVLIRHTSNLFYPIIGGNNYPSVTNNDSRGLYIANRVNSTTIKGFKNNSLVVSGNQDSGLLSRAIYIGARNKDNAPEQYTDRECAFASIGDGLTDTEAANLYTAVQAYQTSLNRQV